MELIERATEMYLSERIPIGIYEKALPPVETWRQKFDDAAQAGFDFVEISIDESDERLSRLTWTKSQRAEFVQQAQNAGNPVFSLCLSAHRKFALGSADKEIRARAFEIMHQAVELSADIGARVIQLAGYYVYYEEEDADTEKRYAEGLAFGLRQAEKAGVMLALENVDGVHVNSVERAMRFVNEFNSPWFQIYPDIGNLTEQGLDVLGELEKGWGHYVGLHVKDVRKGQVRRIPFGEGLVDFEGAFKKLAKLGFASPVLIEMWNDDQPDAIQVIQAAREFIREKMKTCGLGA